MDGDVLTDALDVFRGLAATDQQEYIKQLQGIAGEKREAEIAELKAKLAALGVTMEAPKPRGRRVGEGGTRASPKAVYRSPDGSQTYSGRGRLPRWASELGITDKEGLEPYRIKE